MAFVVQTASTGSDWQQAVALLRRVYVGEGYTPAEYAEGFIRGNFDPEGRLLVAVRDEQVLGTVLFLRAGSSLQQIARAGEREFRMLAVEAAERGNGVGEALVRACVDRAQADGSTALVLWTQPTMHSAHRLYERLGFVREPGRDQYDPRGFKRLVYRFGFGP